MAGVLVSASRNSSCDAAVAAMVRARPRSAIARRIAVAASSAAALPREALSLEYFDQHDGRLLASALFVPRTRNYTEPAPKAEQMRKWVSCCENRWQFDGTSTAVCCMTVYAGS